MHRIAPGGRPVRARLARRWIVAALLVLLGVGAPAASAVVEPETLDGTYSYSWTRTSERGVEKVAITASLHLVRLTEHEWVDRGSRWSVTGLVEDQDPPPCNGFLRETLAGSGTFTGRASARLSGAADFSRVVLSILVVGDATTTLTYSGGTADNPCPENKTIQSPGRGVTNQPGCPKEPVQIRPMKMVGGSVARVVRGSGVISIDFGCTDTSLPNTVITASGTLKGRPAKLTADAGGPYTVKRAGALRLDGSNSSPAPGRRITSYRWRFAPAGGGCPVRRGGKNGAKPTIKPLCTVNAILTVSDGAGTDTDTALVTVEPRTFAALRLVHKPQPKKLNDAALTVSSGGACLLCSFGRNVCSLDGETGEQRSGHLIHGGLVATPGYQTARMNDPGGPSHGLHYVTGHSLKLNRTSLINAKLWPGGSVFRVNQGHSPNHARDVVALFNSVKAHEQFHSDLAGEELERLKARKKDPVTAIETLVRAKKPVLSAAADAAILAADARLQAATTDARVKQRMRAAWAIPARVMLPLGGGEYAEWSVRSLAEVGDGGTQ